MDHSTIYWFIANNREKIDKVHVRILKKAIELSFLKLGVFCMDGTKVLARANIKHSIRYEDVIKKLKNTKAEIERIKIRLKALIRIFNGLESSEDATEDISSQAKMKEEYEEFQLTMFKLVSLEGALIAGVRELEEETRNKEEQKFIQEKEKTELGKISRWNQDLQ